MALKQPLFINEFQTGSAENANIGIGTFVGVETYSTKGVAKLTRDTTGFTTQVLTLSIGDSYGGGKVAYILQMGDPGYINDGVQRGFITSPQINAGIRWYNGSYTTTGATGTALGTGTTNTATIITSQGAVTTSYAAGFSKTYNGGGFSDWYLPSKDELNKVYINRVAVGIASVGVYWTSTENNANTAIGQDFSSGGQSNVDKQSTNDVLALRSFTNTGTTIDSLPVYIIGDPINASGNIWAQTTGGHIYQSTSNSNVWSEITGNLPILLGRGLILYSGYLLAFTGGQIYYMNVSTPGVWTLWKSSLSANDATPFLFPNDGNVYFCNGSFVGKFGLGSNPTFNPAGVAGTDYFYNATFLPLPNYYIATCLSYFPTNYLAIGTASNYATLTGNVSGIDALVFLWNPTLSTYETPLRIPGGNSIAQILNRNNILYATTNADGCVYSTNGTQFTLVDNIGLRTTYRTAGGAQAPYNTILKLYSQAIGFLSNKMLIGTSSSYGVVKANYGLYPMGVWSIAFLDSGQSTQLEYTISTGTIRDTNNQFAIGSIFELDKVTALIGWRDSNGTSGIDIISNTVFQQNIANVEIESEIFEIGTPASPVPVNALQINLINNLQTGQQIEILGRTSIDKDYVSQQLFTGDGTKNYYWTEKNSFDATRFLQLKIRMATVDSGVDANIAQLTPLLRTAIIS